MLPLYLKLRNFMSYGLEGGELDLKPIQLACLSGGNGHGKSTLIDAITWALWGRSRAAREDDLLRQGTTDMEVELHFMAGGAIYRVIRKRVLRKSGGVATLELAVNDQGQFRAITGATIAETERAIAEVLHLSYETFSNSSLLLQGKADSFTIKKPAERKEVLAEILGLQDYEILSDRARERSREHRQKADLLTNRIQELDRFVATLPQLEAAIERKDQEIRDLDATLVLQETQVSELAGRLRSLAELQASVTRQQHRLTEIEKEEALLHAGRVRGQERLSRVEALLSEEQTLRVHLSELQAVRKENDRCSELLTIQYQLDAALSEQAHAIAAERAIYEGEHRRVRQELEKAQQAHIQLTARCAELTQLRAKVAQLSALQDQKERSEREDRTLLEQTTTLRAETETLKLRRDELRKKLESLKLARAVCPVCDGPLDEVHRDQLKKQTLLEGTGCKEQMAEKDSQIQELTGQQERTRRQISELDRQIAALQQQRHQMGSLEQQVRDLEGITAELPRLLLEESRCATVLTSEAYGLEARTRIQELTQQKSALGYDAAAHAAIRQRIQQLSPVEARSAALDAAREERRAALSELDGVDVRLAAVVAERARLLQDLAPVLEATRALPQVRIDFEQQQSLLVNYRAHQTGLQQERGSLLNQRDSGRKMLAERDEATRARDEANQQAWSHRELSIIFGKTGVQAMLIENALPELEEYANDLLARMTDNSTQVSFVTRRGTKSGSAVETLDIRIADNMGTRTYEMFSGGEAFRINLAIRIALSKLLARRAGAELSFLLIDEGFGSQDVLGRDRLVEAITAIAEDFQKILIVTHIDELKEHFDVHIEITKGPAGSQIMVSAA